MQKFGKGLGLARKTEELWRKKVESGKSEYRRETAGLGRPTCEVHGPYRSRATTVICRPRYGYWG